MFIERSHVPDPGDYTYIGLWKEALFAAYFWVRWFDRECADVLGSGLTDGRVMALAGGHFLIHKDILGAIGRHVDHTLVSRDVFFYERLLSSAQQRFETALDHARRIKSSPPDVLEFDILIREGESILFFWLYGYMLSDALDECIVEHARRESVRPEDVARLVPPVRSLLFYHLQGVKRFQEHFERRGLLSDSVDVSVVLNALEHDAELLEVLQQHVDEYGWVEVFNFLGDDLSLERLVEHIVSHPETEEVTDIRDQYSLSDAFDFALQRSSEISYLRQYSAEVFSVFTYHVRPFLYRIADQLGVSYQGFLHLTPDEITMGLCGELHDVLDRVSRRVDGNWMCFGDQENRFCLIDSREEVRSYTSLLVSSADRSVTALHGQVGNRGYTQGVVRVIFATEDFHKMQPGDVIVTTMTTPDFVILMQQSCAIVTDIGGLLCHAAIVSRELGKPCVIGTKFATQILSDGDRVEVDADRGVVRKIDI